MRESVLETMDSLNLPDSICISIVNSARSTTYIDYSVREWAVWILEETK